MTPLTPADLARIDAYRGDAGDLHALLAALPPLTTRREWSADVTAQRGTRMRLLYAAAPHPDGIEIAWACIAPDLSTVVSPRRSAVVTPRGMGRPKEIGDDEWRETRAAAGIVLRALLLGIGDPPP